MPQKLAAKRIVSKQTARKGTTLRNKPEDSISKPRLLDLPLEIRQLIYKYVLVKEHRIEIVSPLDTLSRSHPESRKCKPSKGATALLKVNKAIHHDAARYFYENNHFVIRISVSALHRLNTFTYTEKSITRANDHGLRCFLTRVPRFYVSCIKEPTILISLATTDPEYWPCDSISYGGSPSTAYISDSIMRQFQDLTAVTLSCFSSPRVANIISSDADSEKELAYSYRNTPQPWKLEESLFKSFHNLFQYENLERITLRMDLNGDSRSYLFCPKHHPWRRGGLIFRIINASIERALKNQDGDWESSEDYGIETTWVEVKTRAQTKCASLERDFGCIFQRKEKRI
ncbi:hypothetical protein BOTCAL_0273g00160 [Botryotinia calthae]|uniref:F-box domain-containing protein n=1 Tax=Botryotinia calthae TaxID=38488 RepID=A0A4Y8CVM4_9HELO|nr:hypothetical protein BOTCAL_0273g00160 [Botryotinia calthae]